MFRRNRQQAKPLLFWPQRLKRNKGQRLYLPRSVAFEEARSLFRFAHLTDIHFTFLPNTIRAHTPTILQAAIRSLNEQDIDFVLMTGDLFNFPHLLEAEIESFVDLMKQLRHPVFVSIGNHDVRGHHARYYRRLMIQHLAEYGFGDGPGWYHFSPYPGFRFLILDSTDAEDGHYPTAHGRISPTQLRWVEEVLQSYRNDTFIIAVHHPLVDPYPMMKKLSFYRPEVVSLEAILRNYPNVAMILSGHYHMSGAFGIGHIHHLLTPSLAEYPHGYRIFDMVEGQNGVGWACFENIRTPLAGEEKRLRPMARARSVFFSTLSKQNHGAARIILS